MERNGVVLTEPDAERLSLLTAFVHTTLDGYHLQELERKVNAARVCEPAFIPPNIVTMNSRIRVRYLDTDAEAVYTLVFPCHANRFPGAVSVLGSLGRALLGARLGEVIEYTSGVGRRRCRIEAILYQPEATGDYSG